MLIATLFKKKNRKRETEREKLLAENIGFKDKCKYVFFLCV